MSNTSESPGPLGQLAVIDATGSDAESFLQGQFCNDTGALDSSGAQLTGYCSPKGRLLATPILQRLDTGFRLIVAADLADTFAARLRMFVVRAPDGSLQDVTLKVRPDLACVAVFDANDPIFASTGVSAPENHMAVAVSDEVSVMRWADDENPRWLAVMPVTTLPDHIQGDKAREAESSWRLANIRTGMPIVVDATREAFVPQMMNLAEVDGLSFTKGCYPGQEIVARTQYLGKLKKHMQRFVAASGELPAAGQTLGEAGTAEAGEVVDAVALDDGSIELLAVVRIERPAAAPLPLTGGEAQPSTLPYLLPGLNNNESP